MTLLFNISDLSDIGLIELANTLHKDIERIALPSQADRVAKLMEKVESEMFRRQPSLGVAA